MKYMIAFLISLSCLAQDAIAIKQGEIAPFSGNLIKTERLEEFYKSHKKLPLLEAQIELEKQRLELYKDRVRSTEKELTRAKTKAYLGTIGGFALGVIITSIAARAALEGVR